MFMKNKRLQGMTVIIAMVVLTILPCYFATLGLKAFSAKGAYWMSWDPDYAYFIGGVNQACDIGYSGYYDHPGMGLKYLIAGVIRIAHPFMSADTLRLTALANSELYMYATNVVMLLLLAVLTWLTAVALLRTTGSIVVAISAQIGPLLYFKHYIAYSQKIAAEILLIVFAQALCLVCVNVLTNKDQQHTWRYALMSAIICALAVSTKMNFAPLLIIPCFMLPRLRWKVFYVVSCVVLICIFCAQIPSRFLSTVLIRLVSSGNHARGPIEVALPMMLTSLKAWIRSDMPFFAVLVASGAAAMIGTLSALFSSRVRDSRAWLILLGVWLGATLQVICVARNGASYYMMPAFGLCGLLLALSAVVLRSLPWGRIMPKILSYGLIAGIIYFGLVSNIGAIKKTRAVPPVRYMRLTEFYRRMLNDPSYDAVIISKVTSHLHSLFEGERTWPYPNTRAIDMLYPRVYFYKSWIKKPRQFLKNGKLWTAEEILGRHNKVLFITRKDELFEFRPDQMDIVATSSEKEVAYLFKPIQTDNAAQKDATSQI